MGVDIANLARRYMIEVWARGDVDAINELVDPDIILRDPLTPLCEGIHELREKVEGIHRSFSDVSLALDEIIVSGDRIVVRDTWRGTHRGEFLGMAGTGRTLTVPCVDILRIELGKISENLTYFDVYSVFVQLGVLPRPENLVRAPTVVNAFPPPRA